MKAFAVVVLVLVVVQLLAGGTHGPGAARRRPPRRRSGGRGRPRRPMTMPRGLRKLALTVQVVSSVGRLGAVAVFLALSVAGLGAADGRTVRAVYLAMQVTAWWVLVPLALASLVSGVVQALGTPWGLLRHWWVVIKLALTVVATLVLLLYTQTIDAVAEAAAGAPAADVDAVRSPSPVGHAGAALAVLLTAAALSIFKPRGTTPYGRRRRGDAIRRVPPPASRPGS